jgi:hypothetical protein
LCIIGEVIFAPRLENAGPMAGGLKIKKPLFPPAAPGVAAGGTLNGEMTMRAKLIYAYMDYLLQIAYTGQVKPYNAEKMSDLSWSLQSVYCELYHYIG